MLQVSYRKFISENGVEMELTQWSGTPAEFDGQLLVIARYENQGPSAIEKDIDGRMSGALSAAAERLYFSGKPRQVVTLDTLGTLPASRILLVGLGEEEKSTQEVARTREQRAERHLIAVGLPMIDKPEEGHKEQEDAATADTDHVRIVEVE